MPKIVSWDVGVKNLAYCMMEPQKSKTNPYKIHAWEKINLMQDNIPTCDECKSDAKWQYETKTKSYYYCTKHKKIQNVLILADKRQQSKYECCKQYKDKTKKCTDEIKYYVDIKSKKRYYCSKHKPDDHYVLNKVKKTTAKKIPVSILQKSLFEKLDSMPELLLADIIVIENQPSLKNPKMKAIACSIFDFFMMRSTIDRDIVDTNINKVVYQSPSNKLKLDENNALVLAKTNKKEKYKMTKELAVKYTKQLLKHDKEQLNMLSGIKKIDDLCDAFLQGCYFLSHKL